MDYIKIGNFIASERKNKKLTQAKLAEKLFISEKTVSKWENGRGIPDTDVLPKLCEVFGISINELLSGERLDANNYVDKAENKLLELQKAKENCDKNLLQMEIVIGVLSTFIILALAILSGFLNVVNWIKIAIMIIGFAVGFIGFLFALKIEQIAGYYVCRKCGHKHIPTYSQVNLAAHIGRTRYMKCPNCNKKSWQKKVVK